MGHKNHYFGVKSAPKAPKKFGGPKSVRRGGGGVVLKTLCFKDVVSRILVF